MVLASLLSSTKYIIVNKDLIKMLGLHEAIILGELCSEYTYWESTKQLEENEYFYSTRENIEKNTGINAHFQRIAIKNLEEKGILLCKRMGIPCKKYYKINENAVVEYLRKSKDNLVVHEMNDKNEIECNSNNLFSEKQEQNNMNINNNNINNNINNNEEHILNSCEEKNEYATKVTMTEKEYQDLINKYGEEIAKESIEQLSLYKQEKGQKYDSDYAAILRWVIYRVQELKKEKINYENIKKTKFDTYNQREYSSGFFDSLYANKQII